MNKNQLKKYLPLLIALGVGLLAAIFYFASGRSNLNQNLRDLEKSSTIEKVVTTANNDVVVKCKNGESYEIMYQPGQTNYQDLVFNKCGDAGLDTSSTQQGQ